MYSWIALARDGKGAALVGPLKKLLRQIVAMEGGRDRELICVGAGRLASQSAAALKVSERRGRDEGRRK